MTEIEYKIICKQEDGYDIGHIVRVFIENDLTPHIDYEKRIGRASAYEVGILKVPRDQYQNAMSIFRKINENQNKNVKELTFKINSSLFLFFCIWVIAGLAIYLFTSDIEIALTVPLIFSFAAVYVWGSVRSVKKDEKKNL